MKTKSETVDNCRAARKFTEEERANPFARTVDESKDSTEPKDRAGSGKRRASQLLDKFDLTRNDLLHHMNELDAQKYQ